MALAVTFAFYFVASSIGIFLAVWIFMRLGMLGGLAWPKDMLKVAALPVIMAIVATIGESIPFPLGGLGIAGLAVSILLSYPFAKVLIAQLDFQETGYFVVTWQLLAWLSGYVVVYLLHALRK